MNRYIERVIDHAISITEDMISASRENPTDQRKLREALALLHGAADAIESVGRIDPKPIVNRVGL